MGRSVQGIHKLKAPLVGTGYLLIRRDTFERLGGFTAEVRNGEDLDFCARAGIEPGFVVIDSPYTFVRRCHENQITGDPSMAYQGRMFLLDQEAQGVYPGGKEYESRRYEFLTFWGRAASMQMLREGRPDLSWNFYRRLFTWNLKLGRFKYLLGYPMKVLRAKLAGRGQKSST